MYAENREEVSWKRSEPSANYESTTLGYCGSIAAPVAGAQSVVIERTIFHERLWALQEARSGAVRFVRGPCSLRWNSRADFGNEFRQAFEEHRLQRDIHTRDVCLANKEPCCNSSTASDRAAAL